MKDDDNQAYMQAFNKLSSGYKQAAEDADLAKLLMGNDLWLMMRTIKNATTTTTRMRELIMS